MPPTTTAATPATVPATTSSTAPPSPQKTELSEMQWITKYGEALVFYRTLYAA